jgi:hypothetical protein
MKCVAWGNGGAPRLTATKVSKRADSWMRVAGLAGGAGKIVDLSINRVGDDEQLLRTVIVPEIIIARMTAICLGVMQDNQRQTANAGAKPKVCGTKSFYVARDTMTKRNTARWRAATRWRVKVISFGLVVICTARLRDPN